MVKVPFQLPPNMANECQFIFYVQSFLVPQKLRGTTTYMVKVCVGQGVTVWGVLIWGGGGGGGCSVGGIDVYLSLCSSLNRAPLGIRLISKCTFLALASCVQFHVPSKYPHTAISHCMESRSCGSVGIASPACSVVGLSVTLNLLRYKCTKWLIYSS